MIKWVLGGPPFWSVWKIGYPRIPWLSIMILPTFFRAISFGPIPHPRDKPKWSSKSDQNISLLTKCNLRLVKPLIYTYIVFWGPCPCSSQGVLPLCWWLEDPNVFFCGHVDKPLENIVKNPDLPLNKDRKIQHPSLVGRSKKSPTSWWLRIWGFPEMELPLNHPSSICRWISLKNHPAIGVTPFMGSPKSTKIMLDIFNDNPKMVFMETLVFVQPFLDDPNCLVFVPGQVPSAGASTFRDRLLQEADKQAVWVMVICGPTHSII